MTRFGHHGYNMSPEEHKSFAEAKEYCTSNYPGSTLAMAQDRKMRDEVANAIGKLLGNSELEPVCHINLL